MPYISKWVSAIAAIAHVMRIEKCESAAAMRQIETAAFDRVLRFSDLVITILGLGCTGVSH
jgi:hypothetical protein